MLLWIKAHIEWYKNACCIISTASQDYNDVVTVCWRYVLSICDKVWTNIMHGCTVQWLHCSHSKSHHNILRCTAQNTTSKWLQHLQLLSFCQTSCNFSSNIFLLSVRLLFYFVYPQLTVFSLSNRTTARLARLNFCCLQLVGQLIGELSHDVVHPDVPFFLWSVDQEDRQFPVPGVSGFLYDLQLGHKWFLLHVVPENDGSFLWPLPRLQSCKRDRSS